MKGRVEYQINMCWSVIYGEKATLPFCVSLCLFKCFVISVNVNM